MIKQMLDRERVIAKLAKEIQLGERFGEIDRSIDMLLLRDIDSLLKERRTGRWIEYPKALEYEGAYLPEHIVCSACEHVFCTLDNCTEEFNYCPHCGAKMTDDKQE